MPVQDFALDPAATHRVQVQWASATDPATVMVNRSILGSLSTVAERVAGKDFTLPDGSILRVRFVNNQAQVTRNGSPLGGIRRVVRSAKRPPQGKKLGGCLTTWLILILISSGSSIITNFLQFSGVTKSLVFQQSPAFLLVALLLNFAGIVCAIALLSWKKWGFSLFLCLALFNLGIYYLEHIFDGRPFPSGAGVNILTFILPFIGVGILYCLLRRNNVWEQLA